VSQPGSLLTQWKLVRAASRDRRLSRGDLAVLFTVVDNYYRQHGNSRAAHSYLAVATGLSRRAVISSTKRLRALGYLGVVRIGTGTRPTEYAPNWLNVPTDLSSASGEPEIAAEVTSPSPLAALAVKATTPNPAYVAGLQAGLCKEGPAPPPPGGLGGPPAAPARDPFDEVWNAYGRKQQRSKAKAEYRKLDPDPTLHANLVRAAADWTAAYEAQARPSRFRKFLHTWLAGECWLEDGPEPYENPKMASLTKRRQRDAEVDEEYRTWLQRVLRPGSRALARFIDYVEVDVRHGIFGFDCDLMVLRDCPITGRFTRRFDTESKEFSEFCAACGDDGQMPMDELLGAVLWIVMGKNGRVGYQPYNESGSAAYQVPSPRP
jgi:hypothetical protein